MILGSLPKLFWYNSNLYMKVIPGKTLFKSTMIHEVVNRGDIFAIRLSDQTLTIIPGTAKVIVEADCSSINWVTETEISGL